MIAQQEKADSNNDGAVSLNEFTSYRALQFTRLDRNTDGFITESDIPAMIQRRLPPEMSSENLKARFDPNKDGRVSQTEFVNGPTTTFDRFDTNGDDLATRAELEQARVLFASLKQ